MKPREYLNTFGSDLDTSEKRGVFAQALIQEFDAALKQSHGYSNIKGYEQAIRVLRAKWDSIGTLRGRSLDEKLWKYLFASYIAPTREDAFPEEMRKRAEEKRVREEWRRQEQDFYSSIFGNWFRQAWEDIKDSAPTPTRGMPMHQALSVLGLQESYTLDELKRARRIMALRHHPDVGGDLEKMKEVNAAYDTCCQSLT